MKNKHYLILLLLASSFFACQQMPTQNPDEEVWESIFNGKNIDDWTPKFSGLPKGENYKNIFTVEDSLLKVQYSPQDTFDAVFGHLFYKTPYSYYRIRAVYRFEGEQVKGGPEWALMNNGLMLHCQSPASMGIDQAFPTSLELQLLGANERRSPPNANLCTPGLHVMLADSLHRPHCTDSSSKPYPGEEWTTAEALVLGDSLIQHILDGEVVMEYSKPILDGDLADGSRKDGEAVNSGYISIQAESHPTVFRSIEVLNLCGCTDPKARNYKSYYVKSDLSSCEY